MNILAIDQGTTSSRAMIFDTSTQVVGQHQLPYQQYFPKDGWVEQEASEIWQSSYDAIVGALKNSSLSAKDITCIGIANQRETTILWDRKTGEPVYRAIVWQDRRTAKWCQQLKGEGHEALVQQQTGLLLDPYFSATKIAWILEHVTGARARAEAGDLAFGTVDTYLVWQLTQGKSHITDISNASRTLLYDIERECWSDELLALFNIPRAILPDVVDNAGQLATASIFDADIPITGMAGDQQAALVGQACFEPGMIKSTYGTGCFVMQNTGDKLVRSQHRLLSTVAYRLQGNIQYAIEGSIFIAGAGVQWLRDGLGIIKHASEVEALAQQVASNEGVYLVPAFTGLGAPYWDPNARGAILGLTRDSKAAHIARACLEAVCYQTKDLLMAKQQDGAQVINSLRVDGGMVANNGLVQFLADILEVEVKRPVIIETTALGAAFLAGLGAGLYADFASIVKLWQAEANFSPSMPAEIRDTLYSEWQRAINRVLETA